jgi:hypothetical protein
MNNLMAPIIFSTIIYRIVQTNIANIKTERTLLKVEGFFIFFTALYKPTTENNATIMVKKLMIVDII